MGGPKIPAAVYTRTYPGDGRPEERTIDELGRTIAEFGLRIGAIKLNPDQPPV